MIVTVPGAAAGKRLSDWLNENRIPYLAPCAGNGTCGKCAVKVLSGMFMRYGSPDITLVPDENGKVLACRAVCTDEGATVEVDDLAGKDVSDKGATSLPSDVRRFGAALDIGTTTLALALVDLDSKEALTTASLLNPQASFGADVMSRIDACAKGNLSTLQFVLLKSVNSLLSELFHKVGKDFPSEKRDTPVIEKMTVVGNPTMLHIFCGISPEGMGQYPFTPAFVEEKRLKGSELGLPVEDVFLLPSASAFIGSDAVGGAALAGLAEEKENALLLDIGTNGEMILSKQGELFATSCAAGPALEGAGISCGMGGVPGAVSAVTVTDGEVSYRTVGDSVARGLSGSGLVDLAAALLDLGILDETGALDEDYRLAGRHLTEGGIGENMPTRVTLTGEDVRALQLVKSAFRAGLETLLSVAELTPEDLDAVYLAGGLGYYMNPMSAARIGLLPEAILPSVKVLGNGALSSAIKALCENEILESARKIGQHCITIELNEQPLFSKLFIEYMLFG